MQVPLESRRCQNKRNTCTHNTAQRLLTRRQRSKDIAQSGERPRITITIVSKSPSIQDTQQNHTIPRFKPFLHFIIRSHSSNVEVLARGLIGTCVRCRPLKNVTTAPDLLLHTVHTSASYGSIFTVDLLPSVNSLLLFPNLK